jgi:ribosomal RNA-processing protein 7
VQLLKDKVDEAMELFEDEERLKRLEAQKMENQVDEDGFVLVTKSKKRANVDGSGAAMHSITKEEALKLKPKETVLVDFYRFQMREKKRTGIYC